jgi:hypothetical protein
MPYRQLFACPIIVATEDDGKGEIGHRDWASSAAFGISDFYIRPAICWPVFEPNTEIILFSRVFTPIAVQYS